MARSALLRRIRRVAAVASALSVIALPATAVATPGASGARVGPGPVLYVGDSLGVGTVPYLRGLLPRVALEADARVGRTSAEGLAVLRWRLRRDHRVVVFDLGTNDWTPSTLSRNLRDADVWGQGRRMIVFTLNKPGVEPLNDVVRQFAERRSNVTLIDWHARAAREHLLAGDGIHAGPAGYARRARVVARVISRSR